MYEQVTGNWTVRLYALLDPMNLPSLLHLLNKTMSSDPNYTNRKMRDINVILGYLILFWTILYLLFEKCFNSLFRRMRLPLIQRSRMIRAVWNFGFCSGCLYISSSTLAQFLNFAPQMQEITHWEIEIAKHKAFYLHQAGIDILCHGTWVKGCANLLLALSILNPYLQSSIWFSAVTNIFLKYKTLDIMMVSICQFVWCVCQTFGRSICKILFIFHILIWTYFYLLYVPTYMLWSEEVKYAWIKTALCFWFTVECLNSVWLKMITHPESWNLTWLLENCLFPPPSQEAIELTNIYKRHKESLKKVNNTMTKRMELCQTLVCAMAIKKKIKRIRQVKNNTD